MLRLMRMQTKVPQARLKSTVSTAGAQNAASNVVKRTTDLANRALYWSKVGLELGKYVWTKEGLSPPTVQQFQKAFTQDLLALRDVAVNTAKSPRAILQQAASVDRQKVIKGAAAAVQLLGIFSLGEIIGRRHVYGYKSHSSH